MVGYGFSFRGKHTKDLNIYVKTDSRILMGAKRERMEVIDGKDGTNDTKGGYDNVTLRVRCTLRCDDYMERRRKTIDIAKWLYSDTYDVLVFDDDPDVFYRAKVRGPIYTQIRDAVSDVFEIEFICKPFKYNNSERVVYLGDSDVYLGQQVPLGGMTNRIFPLASQTITIPIDSSVNIKEYRIIIEGTATKVKINDMVISNVTGKTCIDCGRKLVYQIGLSSVVNKMNDYNLIFEEIKKDRDYIINIEVEGGDGTGTITFDIQNIYI